MLDNVPVDAIRLLGYLAFVGGFAFVFAIYLYVYSQRIKTRTHISSQSQLETRKYTLEEHSHTVNTQNADPLNVSLVFHYAQPLGNIMLLASVATEIFHNPIYMWGQYHISLSNGKGIVVPYPVFRWRVLFRELDPKVVTILMEEFFEKFEDDITDADIYLPSNFAATFLFQFNNRLNKLNARAYNFDIFNPPPNDLERKVIVFDVSLSTASTITNLLDSAKNVHIDRFIFLFMNDLVPHQLQQSMWNNYGNKISFLYSVSQLFSRLPKDSHQRKIASILLALREAYSNTKSWESKDIIEALASLRSNAFGNQAFDIHMLDKEVSP